MEATIKKITRGYTDKLQPIEHSEGDILQIVPPAIKLLEEMFKEIKAFISDYTFKDEDEEIRFFKEIKPQLFSKLIYYQKIYRIEALRPNGSDEAQKQYLGKELDHLKVFFDKNLDFYKYYRSGGTHFDKICFMRFKPNMHMNLESFYFERDPKFSSHCDFKVSKMMANDLIGIYLKEEYVDYTRLYRITKLESSFVVRAKKNLKFEVKSHNPVDETTGVMTDQTGFLKGFYTSKDYPESLRRVAFYDMDKNTTLIFLTNNFELTADQVAMLYKNRWQIELFFKWIKQHLKIKSFWGTSRNAVRIQIYSAIIAYCLVAIVGHDLQIKRTTYEILQILGISLLDRTPVNELFTNIDINDVKDRNDNQLTLNLF